MFSLLFATGLVQEYHISLRYSEPHTLLECWRTLPRAERGKLRLRLVTVGSSVGWQRCTAWGGCSSWLVQLSFPRALVLLQGPLAQEM